MYKEIILIGILTLVFLSGCGLNDYLQGDVSYIPLEPIGEGVEKVPAVSTETLALNNLMDDWQRLSEEEKIEALNMFGFELECIKNKTTEKYRMVESVEDCISEIERVDYCEGDRWCSIQTFIGGKHIKECNDKIPYIHFWNETICIKEQLVRYKK